MRVTWLLTLVIAAACSKDQGGATDRSPAPSPSTPGTPGTPGTPAAATPGKACIEACPLLDAAEIAKLIGASARTTAKRCIERTYISDCQYNAEGSMASLVFVAEPRRADKIEVWKSVNKDTEPVPALGDDAQMTTGSGQQQLLFTADGYMFWFIVTGKQEWTPADRDQLRKLGSLVVERAKAAPRIAP